MDEQRRIELVTRRAVESAISYFEKFLSAATYHDNPRREEAMTHYRRMSKEALDSINHLRLQLSPETRERLQYLSILSHEVSDIVLGQETQAA